MKSVKPARALALLLIAMVPCCAQAMGLRSFVALPVNKGGLVLRFQYFHNVDTDRDVAFANAALGLSGKDTLLLGVPYRVSPSGDDRLGDFSALYRRTLWQEDGAFKTSRFALLAGAVLASDSNRDGALQLGGVATFYRDRNSFDIDALYRSGLGSRPDDGRYDISWQYRLAPGEYPEWGFPKEWYSVLELNGRWREGNSIDHQLTAGFQRISHNWVLEGGIIQTVNNERETQIFISTRHHF